MGSAEEQKKKDKAISGNCWAGRHHTCKKEGCGCKHHKSDKNPKEFKGLSPWEIGD